MKLVRFAALAAMGATSALTLGACSSVPENTQAQEERDRPEYITGSILPRKPGYKSPDVIEASPGSIQNASRPTSVLPSPGVK